MQRNTVQRQIILDAIKKYNTHPTVDELYLLIQKTHPAISKTTIYRNLRQLAHGGQIGRVALPGNAERYDCRADQHCHFQCRICADLHDVDIECVDDIGEQVKKKYGFIVEGHDIIFKGICLKCGKRGDAKQ